LIFVNPAAGFDVDLLAGSESDFEYVAVAVQPEDAVAAMGDESIDEEAGTAHEHVGDAFDAGEGVVELIGGGEKLMLADVEAVALGEVDGEKMAGAVAAEGDATGPWASVMKMGMPERMRLKAPAKALMPMVVRGSFQSRTWCSK